MEQLSQLGLAGNGDGGEGLAPAAAQGWPAHLYLAHEGQKMCLSVVDVTDPRAPSLIAQLPSPGPAVTRCNSLGCPATSWRSPTRPSRSARSGGMWLLDVSDLERVKRARRLEDLKLGSSTPSGSQSRGVHWLWFVDGDSAHLATGAGDFEPGHPATTVYMIVDVRNPRAPPEVGRWWLPGTRTGDSCLPGCLPKRQKIDDGYRAHSIQIYPRRPDRAYVATAAAC